MVSQLEKIKSTITISLGMKNRLRQLKGSRSYEEFIGYLLKERNKLIHRDNYIEHQKFERKKAVLSLENFKIIFSYNEFQGSENHFFDISIDKIRKNGKITNLKTLITNLYPGNNFIGEYKLYFKILNYIIQTDIETLFKHKGRFENFYLWEQEFYDLGLSKKTFEHDVMDILKMMENKEYLWDLK